MSEKTNLLMGFKIDLLNTMYLLWLLIGHSKM
jgi:hypothetical protein